MDEGKKLPADPTSNSYWLKAAGYVLDDDVWEHPITRRMLDAGIALKLSLEQLLAWIASGENGNGSGR